MVCSKDADCKGRQVGRPASALPYCRSLDDAQQLDDAHSKREPSPSSNTPVYESTANILTLQDQMHNAAAVATAVQGSSATPIADLAAEHASVGDQGVPNSTATVAAEAAEPMFPTPSTGNTQDACSVFFARVPPTVPYESILALFQHFGTVKSLNLFRPWASAKTSKVGTSMRHY